MCTFVSLWFACGNFRTGHGRLGRVIPGARLCAEHPRCELLVSRHPMWLPYRCYNCMHEAAATRRDNLFLAMQQVQMPLPGVPERLVPALGEGPEPEPQPEPEREGRAALPVGEGGGPEVGEVVEERAFVYRGLI